MRFNPRLLLFIALVAGITAVSAACGDGGDDDEKATGTSTPSVSLPAGSTMAQIAQRGKVIIGVKFDQPLFGLLDPVTKKVDGFDIALGKEIAKAMGLREDQIEFVEAVSANRIPFLQEDKVDLVIATMTITAQRKEQIEFSRPYYLAGQTILVKKDNTTITKVDDLNGKKVCSVQGSTSEKNVVEKAPRTELLSLQVYSACVDSMKVGRVDAVSTDDIILAGFASTDKDLKLVGGQFTQEPYGIGIKKGKTDMAQFVNKVLEDMMKDGRWEAIYKKYLGEVGGLPSPSEAKAKLPTTA